MTYAVAHDDYWNRHTSNWGKWYIYEVNPNAAAYDSPGTPVAWMSQSPFVGGSASHIDHTNKMEALAKRIAEGLNADAKVRAEA